MPTTGQPSRKDKKKFSFNRKKITTTPNLDELSVGATNIYADQVVSANLLRMIRVLPKSLSIVSGFAWESNSRAMMVALLAHVGSGLLTAFGLLTVTQVLTNLLAGGPTPERLMATLPTLVLLVTLYALRGLLDTAITAATGRLMPMVRRNAERKFVCAVSGVELAAFDESDFYDAMSRARFRGISSLEMATERSMALLGAAISLAATSTTVAVLHPLLLPVLLMSILPEAWSTLKSAKLDYQSYQRTLETSRRFNMIASLLDERESAAELRAFTAQKFLLGEHERLSGAMEHESISLANRKTTTSLIGRSLSGVGIGLAYVVLGWLLYVGATPLAVTGTAVIAIRTLRSSLTQLVSAVNRLFEHGLYIDDYCHFIRDVQQRTRKQLEKPAPTNPKTIEVKDVWFSYPEEAEPALRGVSFTAQQGQIIALVGLNGSGKSTLAKILAGLYLPTKGAVLWDGISLDSVNERSIADQVAVVMQSITRWPFTIRQNVTLGRPERHDPHERILTQIAQDSGADTVVASAPHGWDTLLTKRFRQGHDLSGGQWQRLSVARALYRDAPILICDEPTAALDAKAEAAVYDSLRTLQAGRTVFLITHRLASVRDADCIVVLESGSVLEIGTHSELMAANGRYAELFNLQAEAYRDQDNLTLPINH